MNIISLDNNDIKLINKLRNCLFSEAYAIQLEHEHPLDVRMNTHLTLNYLDNIKALEECKKITHGSLQILICELLNKYNVSAVYDFLEKTCLYLEKATILNMDSQDVINEINKLS